MHNQYVCTLRPIDDLTSRLKFLRSQLKKFGERNDFIQLLRLGTTETSDSIQILFYFTSDTKGLNLAIMYDLVINSEPPLFSHVPLPILRSYWTFNIFLYDEECRKQYDECNTVRKKRSIIIYAKKFGNRKAVRYYDVPESNVRLYRMHWNAIFGCQHRCINFRGRKMNVMIFPVPKMRTFSIIS